MYKLRNLFRWISNFEEYHRKYLRYVLRKQIYLKWTSLEIFSIKIWQRLNKSCFPEDLCPAGYIQSSRIFLAVVKLVLKEVILCKVTDDRQICLKPASSITFCPNWKRFAHFDLNQNQYAIWASGEVNNGLPAFHITYFESSLGAINIRFEPGLVSVHSVKILSNMGSIEKVTGSCHLPWIRVFRSFSNI